MNITANVKPDDTKNLMALAIDGCGQLHGLLANAIRVSSLEKIIQSSRVPKWSFEFSCFEY